MTAQSAKTRTCDAHRFLPTKLSWPRPGQVVPMTPPRPAPTVRTAHSYFQLSTADLQTSSRTAAPDRLAKGRPPEVGGGLSCGGWGGSRVLLVIEGKDVLAGQANLPRMRGRAVRALTLARPARGNHTRQGAGFRSGLVFAFSPLTRVIGLRPGRPRMRTLRVDLCCAGALSLSSGADRGSFTLGGADPARRFHNLGDRRWVSSVGADSRYCDQSLCLVHGKGPAQAGWSR
jgi:hypothetical protein